MNYNFEYKFVEYNKIRVPITQKINNTQYKQNQIDFLKKMFPNGINKEIKLKEEDQLELYEDVN